MLGIHADVETKRARLHGPNIEEARSTISKPVFDAWNTAATLKALLELMVLFAHYDNCNLS